MYTAGDANISELWVHPTLFVTLCACRRADGACPCIAGSGHKQDVVQVVPGTQPDQAGLGAPGDDLCWLGLPALLALL